MKSIKRCITSILISTMLVTSVGVYAEKTTAKEVVPSSINKIMNEDSLVLDFENTNEEESIPEFATVWENTYTTKSGDNTSLVMPAVSRVIFDFDPVSSGRYLLSYESKQITSGEDRLTTRLLGYDRGTSVSFDDTKQFEVQILTENKFEVFKYQNGIWQGGFKQWGRSAVTDEANKLERNRCDIYLDLDDRVIYHYLNNKFICKEVIAPRLAEIYGMYITLEAGAVEVDNIIFTEADYNITSKMEEIGVAYPDSWKGKLYMNAVETEENFGFNYFTGSPTVELDMVNEASSKQDYAMKYELMDDKGFIVWEKEEELSFEANEQKLHQVKVDADCYGIMTLIATATDKADGNVSQYRRHIALINAPENGKQNPVMGATYQFRPTHADYYDDMIGLMGKAGFSNIRFEWTNANRTYDSSGKFVLTEDEKIGLEAAKENKLLINIILMHNHKDPVLNMPVTDSELEDWKHYCEQVALLLKDYPYGVAYEIWNEPNIVQFNPNATVEDYIKLVKISYNTIKKIDPDAIIVGGSNSGFGGKFANDFMAGAADSMDVISLHPYTWMQGPEAGQLMPRLLERRATMDELGCEEKSMWTTEHGWYLHVGVPEQAIYTVQEYILNQVNDNIMSKIQTFDFVDNDAYNRENFGLINASVDYDSFLARPSFVAMANYNTLMTDSVYDKTIEYEPMQNVYHFKLADGRDMITFWTLDGNNPIAFDLGTDSVEVCDLYGNTEKQYGVDGKFQFDANPYPQYIIGNFRKLEKCAELFSTNKDVLNVVNFDKSEIAIDNRTNRRFEVSSLTSANVTAPADGKIGKERKSLIYSMGDISAATEKVNEGRNGSILSTEIRELVDEKAENVEIRLTDGGKLYYKKLLNVFCVPDVTVEHYIAHNVGDRWQYIIEATNNKHNEAVKGKVEISAPEGFSKRIPSWSTGTINAGQKKKIKIPIPDLMDRSETNFEGKLVLDSGFSVDVSQELSFQGLTKTRIAPTIDGALDKGEWPDAYKIELNRKSGTIIPVNGTHTGDSDASAEIYMCFDDTKLYFAARVKDDVQAEDPQKRLWSCDGFQFNVAMEKKTSASYTELGLALCDGVPAISRTSGLIAQGLGAEFPNELMIVRDESAKETIYEFAVPFTEIYPPDFNVREYSNLNISILLNDRDSEEASDRDSMLEWGSGIGLTKDPAQYFTYSLIR